MTSEVYKEFIKYNEDRKIKYPGSCNELFTLHMMDIAVEQYKTRLAEIRKRRGLNNRLIAAALKLLAMLRDCESYAHAMGKFNGSGEGAQLAARCRELIAKVEGKNS
jgi:hypothetical protein